METQKKVVEGESCFVCARIVPKKEKVYMFGETSIDFCAIISSALNVALMWGITLPSGVLQKAHQIQACFGQLKRSKT